MWTQYAGCLHQVVRHAHQSWQQILADTWGRWSSGAGGRARLRERQRLAGIGVGSTYVESCERALAKMQQNNMIEIHPPDHKTLYTCPHMPNIVVCIRYRARQTHAPTASQEERNFIVSE